MEKGVVQKGFKAFRNNVKSNNNRMKQIKSCNSCKFYYEDEDDESEEICYNTSVTSFDMVEEGNLKCCTFWTPIWHKE